MQNDENKLVLLEREVVRCEKCPRLRDYCRQVAREKRRAFRDWDYWGKPIPGFGDPHARLLVVGLAPAAHGANRTGRVFTGDRSGDFLFRALHETGFASQPESTHAEDGLCLSGVFVTAAVRCAPPDNKPSREEFARCRPYLDAEMRLLGRVKGIVALGKLAFDACLDVMRDRGVIPNRGGFVFGHDVLHTLPENDVWILSSYHPSQQNTSTGRLTAQMLRGVFQRARRML